ncbi:MAG: hypothetical protein EGQ23_02845 [Solobacterium sp.]|nr:hypothetical protein [Solobacterium sp.]
MSNINLYKIDNKKKEEFLKNLNYKFDNENNAEVISKQSDLKYRISVYIDGKDKKKKDPDWIWILKNPKEVLDQPASLKAIVVIEPETRENLYVCTYGAAYFSVDKYCDTEFAFNFARRIKFEQVKTTTLTSPNSRKNKTVNVYLNYSEIAFDSGEAYAKIKAKTLIDYYGEKPEVTIEIGHSIKTKMLENNFIEMVKFIEYVEYTIKHNREIQKIPVFAKVTNKDVINELDQRLLHEINDNLDCINVSELDIIGVTEVFNDNDSLYTLKLNGFEMTVSDLNRDCVEQFITVNNIDLENDFFKIKVEVHKENAYFSYYMKKIIDYTDDERKCILIKGEWYHYNDDYVAYLNDSMKDLEVKYISDYDYSSSQFNTYRNKKKKEERNDEKYVKLTDEEFNEKIEKKYYKERVFNNIMEEEYGFKNYDRTNTVLVGGEKLEVMDLYKDKTMFAVKLGHASSKLNYVVNQSLDSFRLYRTGELKTMPEINTIAVWLIFDNNSLSRLLCENTDLSQMKLLGLKNRLDEWKKEVRVHGYKPVVYVNKWVE